MFFRWLRFALILSFLLLFFKCPFTTSAIKDLLAATARRGYVPEAHYLDDLRSHVNDGCGVHSGCYGADAILAAAAACPRGEWANLSPTAEKKLEADLRHYAG